MAVLMSECYRSYSLRVQEPHLDFMTSLPERNRGGQPGQSTTYNENT